MSPFESYDFLSHSAFDIKSKGDALSIWLLNRA